MHTAPSLAPTISLAAAPSHKPHPVDCKPHPLDCPLRLPLMPAGTGDRVLSQLLMELDGLQVREEGVLSQLLIELDGRQVRGEDVAVA